MKEGSLPKGRVILFACLGFIFGIGIFSFAQNFSGIWCFGICVISCLVVVWLHYGQRLFLAIIFIIATGFFLAGWRYSLSYPIIDSNHISFYNGQVRTFEGIISKEPVEKNQRWQLTIKTDQGKVLVTTDRFPEYSYGDVLEITCKLEAPENKDFPYDRYLARFGIYSLCSRPHITLLHSGGGNIVIEKIIKIKQEAYTIAQANLSEPESSLALPVVFGGGQGIDDDITEEFRRTGLTHIMAVSGFNVSLLTVLIGLGLNAVGLRRRYVFYVTSLVITAYVIMVGAPASAVRAGVMSLFLLAALTLGRLVSLPRSVILVAVMTLLVNPRLLRDDIGWQLSFLAILGLVYLQPFIQKGMMRVFKNRGKWILEALTATISAQVATAPVILYNFGNFSIIAPFSNLLVVWVVPILTIAMMASLALTALFPSLGLFFFFPCWVMVKYIFWIVQILSGISWAAVEIE
jgi:competence protein ComEC